MKLFVLSVSLFFCSLLISKGQSNDDCLMCHSDHDMTVERGSKTFSLWVDNSKFSKSVHKNQRCVSCHKGFNPDDIPHKAKILPVDCKSCHTDVEKKHTFHPWMASAPLKDNCKHCHGYHDVSKPKGITGVGGLNAAEKCGVCHKEIKEEYMKSEHYQVLLRKDTPNAPDCIYCHNNPITKGWNIDYQTRKINQINVCIACHSIDSKNLEVLKKIDYDNSRHAILRKSGKEHAAVCTDCHGFHNIQKNQDFEAKLNPKNSSSTCGKCHVHISQEYQNSIHGLAQMKGNMQAASCVSCHSEHIKDNNIKISSSVYKQNLLDKDITDSNKTNRCIACHTNDSLINSSNLKTLVFAHKWLPYLEKHFAKVSCYDCHASYTEPYLSHNILPIEKSLKNCNDCHSKSLELKSILYRFEKGKSVDKEGIIRGSIDGNANYVGLAKNIILDYLSLIIMGGLILVLIIHAYIRWYFKKERNNNEKN